MQSPVLYINLSNEHKQHKLMPYAQTAANSSNAANEDLKRTKQLECEVKQLKAHNDELLSAQQQLQATIDELEQKMKTLAKEVNITYNIQNLSLKQTILELTSKLEQTETTSKQSTMNNSIASIHASQQQQQQDLNYYQRKFCIAQHKSDILSIKENLQKDLTDYQVYCRQFISQTKNDITCLITALQTCVDSISKSFSDTYDVKLYGSRATNLCLLWSDLDVVITSSSSANNQSKATPNQFLTQLHVVLKEQKWVQSIKYLKTARIPIIKLTTGETYKHIQIDVSMEDSTHYGLKCVDLVKQYLTEYEALEPLVFAVKTLLRLSYLNDPYKGGISSYGIILMMVAFLKKQKKVNMANVGNLLCDFLFYYGSNIPNNNYINVNPSTDNHLFYPNLSPFELIIVDPLNIANNVARSTFQFINIKTMFLIALQGMTEECTCACHYYNHNKEEGSLR